MNGRLIHFPGDKILLNYLEQGEAIQSVPAQPLSDGPCCKSWAICDCVNCRREWRRAHEELLGAAKATKFAWEFAICVGNAPASNILDRLSAAIEKCEPKPKRDGVA